MVATTDTTVVERLVRAVNSHDVEAVVACFASDYRNETPAHPERGFHGRDQVRSNWERIFAGVPDITATVLRTAVDGNVVWSEWEMRGTRRTGDAHLLRGPIIFGIDGEQANWARFYLEPVEEGAGGVDAAIGRMVDGALPAMATSAVGDARPPAWLIRVLNPMMRLVLRTPAGRMVRPFALLEFTGQRSGRQFRVPVGWHSLDGSFVVLTPAGWRANFEDGRPVTVYHRGRSQRMTGTLVSQPAEVAAALQSLLDQGTPPGKVALNVIPGHRIDAADIEHVDRRLIRFELFAD